MSPDDSSPLYDRDPAAWEAHLAEGNVKQPRKRVSADVIIRDRFDRLLLVDPKYKPDWEAIATGRTQYLHDGYPP